MKISSFMSYLIYFVKLCCSTLYYALLMNFIASLLCVLGEFCCFLVVYHLFVTNSITSFCAFLVNFAASLLCVASLLWVYWLVVCSWWASSPPCCVFLVFFLSFVLFLFKFVPPPPPQIFLCANVEEDVFIISSSTNQLSIFCLFVFPSLFLFHFLNL